MSTTSVLAVVFSFLFLLAGCKKDEGSPMQPSPAAPKDPNTAQRASIDRFSASAGMLFVRTAGNGLPAANAPINFDQEPFVSQGFGPSGQIAKYYNFDVQSTTPAPIYVLFRQGESTPVAGQINIIDAIPGTPGYNDFWVVTKVTVPSDYVANVVTSKAEIDAAGYAKETTPTIVNCPVVPQGSTAALKYGGGSQTLSMGWYRGLVVFYFNFDEKALMTTNSGMVPLSPIYVSFNINPNQPGGGPPSGFKTETGSMQTHNVVGTLPSSSSYSPLWMVNIYDNADFGSVNNLTTALATNILVPGAANVNCPIVSVQ